MPIAVVLPMEQSRTTKRASAKELRLRRLALQIALQLPEEPEEALMVLELAKTAVRAFMGDCEPV